VIRSDTTASLPKIPSFLSTLDVSIFSSVPVLLAQALPWRTRHASSMERSPSQRPFGGSLFTYLLRLALMRPLSFLMRKAGGSHHPPSDYFITSCSLSDSSPFDRLLKSCFPGGYAVVSPLLNSFPVSTAPLASAPQTFFPGVPPHPSYHVSAYDALSVRRHFLPFHRLRF